MSADDNSGELALSVLVAATHDEHTLGDLCRALEPQLAAVGGEILVADGSPDGITSVPVALRDPGEDIFVLRGKLVPLARGRVIALTEDHVRPSPTYCHQMLLLHERHPDAPVIAGAVDNGSRRRIVDWANYFATFATFMPPLPQTTHRVPPPVNISIKRSALGDEALERGALEFSVMPTMHHQGKVVFDDSLCVEHVQSAPLRHHIAAHFHNGRTTGGLSRDVLPPKTRIWRMLRTPLLPFRLFWDVYREIARRPARWGRGLLAAPAVFLVQCGHAFGEFLGYWRGPAKSPHFLH